MNINDIKTAWKNDKEVLIAAVAAGLILGLIIGSVIGSM